MISANLTLANLGQMCLRWIAVQIAQGAEPVLGRAQSPLRWASATYERLALSLDRVRSRLTTPPEDAHATHTCSIHYTRVTSY